MAALVGAPAWARAAAAARALRACGVDVGLHLDFTEFPCHRASRADLAALIRRSHAGALSRAAVRAEIQAQLDAFEGAIGSAPAFVDGHQHVHQLPIIRDELVSELDARYRDAPPWLRSTRCRWSAGLVAGPAALLKSATIEALGARALQRAARRLGLRQNAALLGVYDFRGGAPRYATLLRGWLRSARTGDLLMCHPARAAVPGDALADQRQAEFQVLSGPALVTAARASGLQLMPMSRILARAGGPTGSIALPPR